MAEIPDIPDKADFAAAVRSRASELGVSLSELMGEAGLRRDYLAALERPGGSSPTVASLAAIRDALDRIAQRRQDAAA